MIDGYVKDRDGSLELHVGNRGTVEEIDATVEYVPENTPIEDVEIDQVVDLAGVVRSADPKRTFDRDDGSEGQVRNIRVQDATDDIRVASGATRPTSTWDRGTRSHSATSKFRTAGRTISRPRRLAVDDHGSRVRVGRPRRCRRRVERVDRRKRRSVGFCRRRSRLRRGGGGRHRQRGCRFERSRRRRGTRVHWRRRSGRQPGRSRRRRDDDERRDRRDVGLGEEVTARGVVRDGHLEANDVF